MMQMLKSLPAPEARSLAIAFLLLMAVMFEPFWASSLHASLPDRFLSSCLFGLMMLFWGDFFWRRKTRAANGWEEPRHDLVFLLTFLGGGAILLSAVIWPDIWTGAIITVAATSVGVLMPGLKARMLGPEGDERYRHNQLRAREAGLRALILLGAGLILVDLAGLLGIPLWAGMGLVLWGVASTITGVMWWLEGRPDD